MDKEYSGQQYWAGRVLGLPRLKRMPSEEARENVCWGFNRNPTSERIARLKMGVEKLMWTNDFPDLDSAQRTFSSPTSAWRAKFTAR